MPALDLESAPVNPASLIGALLDEQQRLTAVEQFSAWHNNGHEIDLTPRQSGHYRQLIPATVPQAGQQYCFEVDLDACSGCKACVTACHNLNGLEPDELWRSVGLLHGGTSQSPMLQHVTTSCHHCLEPACLEGCPVNAYEKDPLSGIVHHLDDQCIGCQYCILKCPYDVPKYSRLKGIVRKCDMCSQRLAAAEAPVCVQACPNRAIRIALVERHQVAEESEANLFLPGAPEPGYTLPTTIYKTGRALPRNLLPADYYSARPQHAHLPLVFMLVFTQMSVGAFVVSQLLAWLPAAVEPPPAVKAVHLAAAFLLGMLGLAASVLHLGRPRYAFRAIIGVRSSWLSREILSFGVFALLASLYAGLPWIEALGIAVRPRLNTTLGSLVALSGVAGVFCSVMIYASTRRPYWNGLLTSARFFLTSAVLGLPTALLIALAAAAWSDDLGVQRVMSDYGRLLCLAMATASVAKLLLEATVFTWLRAKQFTPLKRTALLLTGELGLTTFKRFFLGSVGGVVLPALLVVGTLDPDQGGFNPLFVGLTVLLAVVVTLLAELMERYLFFTAVVAPKMPGAPAS